MPVEKSNIKETFQQLNELLNGKQLEEMYLYNVNEKTKMIDFLAEYVKYTSKTAKKTIIFINEIKFKSFKGLKF